MPVNDNDPYRDWLLGLPADIEFIERLRGEPLVLPDPGTEHGRRLYETLGVKMLEPE